MDGVRVDRKTLHEAFCLWHMVQRVASPDMKASKTQAMLCQFARVCNKSVIYNLNYYDAHHKTPTQSFHHNSVKS